ncbi:MAG: alpha/beta hydrolase [Firmicutes bacterium HGW-Firmicutes-14]|nr:MAG: alpha/beta hydrolase [Firmicutes bacterium HGW-Firmicutes-14]
MEIISFSSRDGCILTGELHCPKRINDRNPALIICHGFRGNMTGSGRAVHLAERFCTLNIPTLRFDFSGTGESEGDFADITLSKYIENLSAAVDFVSSVTKGKIVVLGRSFGGTTAICHAALDIRVGAVCTWAAPSDLTETFIERARDLLDGPEDVFTIPEGDDFYLLKRGFFNDLARYDVLGAASRVSPRPLLIVHGTSDETVPFIQGVRLYEAARKPKSRLFVKEGDHRFNAHYNLVEQETVRWVENLTHYWKGRANVV